MRINIDRRTFAKAIIGIAAVPYFSYAGIDASDNTLVASAISDHEGKHYLALINFASKKPTISKIPLPARAHEVVHHPYKPMVCVVSRRPGYFLQIVDTQNLQVLKTVKPEPSHHFFGHGLFTPDGRYFVSSESQFPSGEGRIFVRDIDKEFKIVAKYSSNGIGPHQIILAPDQQTLIVANGGIKTHPEKGREKLNLETMSPSLDYLDVMTGKVLESRKLSDVFHQLSIRHIDVNKQNLVSIAMQYQGGKYDDVPLVATHSPGKDIELLDAPEGIYPSMKQYCGSVCFDRSGEMFAVTSPKGGLITFWDARTKNLVGTKRCRDVCGLSSNGPGNFLASNGQGKLYQFETKIDAITSKQIYLAPDMAWDNHLALI